MAEDDDLNNVVEAWLSKERNTRVENINRSMVINNNNDVDNRIVNNNNNNANNYNYDDNVNNNENSYAQSESSSYMGSPTNSRLSSPSSKLGINTANFYNNVNNIQSPSSTGGGTSPRVAFSRSRKVEAILEDILENQRKIRSLELKLTRCISNVDTQEETCSRLSRDFLMERQKNSNNTLEHNNLSHQLEIFRKRAENLDVLAQQCVNRREVDQITKALIHPLRSEIQMQLENIGRQFSLHTKRMDSILKNVNRLQNMNDSVNARVSAVVKQQMSSNREVKRNLNRPLTKLSLGSGLDNDNNNNKLSDHVWRQINEHVEAQSIKSQRHMETVIDNRLRLLQSGNGNNISSSANTNTVQSLTSDKSMNDIQMRVQECYANILRLGGQFTQEKERQKLILQSIKSDLKSFIREVLSDPGQMDRIINRSPNIVDEKKESKPAVDEATNSNLTRIARAAAAAEVKSMVKRLNSAEEEIDTLKDVIKSLKSKIMSMEDTNNDISNNNSNKDMIRKNENYTKSRLDSSISKEKNRNIKPATIVNQVSQKINNGINNNSAMISNLSSNNDQAKAKEQIDNQLLVSQVINEKDIPPPPPPDDDEDEEDDEEDEKDDIDNSVEKKYIPSHPDLSSLPAIHWTWKNVKAWLEVVVNANNDVIAIFEKLDVIGVLLLEIEKDDLINDADMKVDDVSEREKLWKEIYKLRRAEGALNDSSDYDDDF